MPTVSLKLPQRLNASLEAEARRQGGSKSAVIRACLEQGLGSGPVRRRVSCFDLAQDLVGSQPGPRDASTNPNYLEKALVADARRRRPH